MVVRAFRVFLSVGIFWNQGESERGERNETRHWFEDIHRMNSEKVFGHFKYINGTSAKGSCLNVFHEQLRRLCQHSEGLFFYRHLERHRMEAVILTRKEFLCFQCLKNTA